MGDYTLLYILFAPFVGAIALIFVSNRQAMLVRGIAAGSAFVSLLASLYLFYAYDPVKGRVSIHSAISNGHASWAFRSISGWMGSARRWCWPRPFCCSPEFSCPGTSRIGPKSFISGCLILAAATIGVFMSLDLFFLYFFYEMSVIPMYLLLGHVGKPHEEVSRDDGPGRPETAGFGRLHLQFRRPTAKNTRR